MHKSSRPRERCRLPRLGCVHIVVHDTTLGKAELSSRRLQYLWTSSLSAMSRPLVPPSSSQKLAVQLGHSTSCHPRDVTDAATTANSNDENALLGHIALLSACGSDSYSSRCPSTRSPCRSSSANPPNIA